MIVEWMIKISSFLIFFVGLFAGAQGTKLETFFAWLGLGGIIAFIAAYHVILLTFLVMLFLMRWVRDVRWLGVIGICVWLFLTYGV